MLRFFQKSFFSPPERSNSFKNRFSARRNALIPSKTVFHEIGDLRHIQKPFFMKAERSDALKNRFSRNRSFPTLQKRLFLISARFAEDGEACEEGGGGDTGGIGGEVSPVAAAIYGEKALCDFEECAEQKRAKCGGDESAAEAG
jgi:hypothetical protein